MALFRRSRRGTDPAETEGAEVDGTEESAEETRAEHLEDGP